MKLIYIAGPYRAPTTWGIAQNIHHAKECGAIVASLGAYPVIPHANTAHMDGVADDALWLAGTLELMRRCDGVVMVGQWMLSTGAIAEHNEAKAIRLPIFNGLTFGVARKGGPEVGGFNLNDVFERDGLRAWIGNLKGGTQ